MITSYNLEFCLVEVYEDYVISIMKEGVVVTPEFIIEMFFIARKHFSDKVFVYISHRINSYSLNPLSYFEVNKIKNLIAMAIVSEDPKQTMQSSLEQAFFGKKLGQFDTIQEALEWKDKVIAKHIQEH